MSAIWRSLLRDERGFVITAELVLISTVLVLGLVAALSAVKAAIAGELSEVAGAVGSANQSYYTHGFRGHGSRTYGSAFLDEADSTDEEKADFKAGTEPCRTTVLSGINSGCTTAPVHPLREAPCAPPCNGMPVLPDAAPCDTPCGTQVVPCETPCGNPCGTPCGSPEAPCGTPCELPVAAPCSACGGSSPVAYGYRPSGGCGSGGSYGLAHGYGTPFGPSVPRLICPPGPGPFTGTDPFAPGAVSPKNMLRQGISYGGVCAPPVGDPRLPAPCCDTGIVAAPPELPGMPSPAADTAPVDPRFREPLLPPQEGIVPTNFEGQYEPAFHPLLPQRGTVY